MPAIPHPSFLELDQLAVGAGSDATRQHAATCTECSAHLARVQAPVAVPELFQRPQPARPIWPWDWRWTTGALTAACAAALLIGIAFKVGVSPQATDAYQVKGSGPGLALYIKRGDRIEAWDGQRPLITGDLLRLQIAPEGFRHVTVDSPGSASQLATHLFDGELSEATAFLPVSWRVDDQPGPEVLEITLTAPGLSPWHSRLVLPKNTKP